MTHRSYTVTLWFAGVCALACALTTCWAATISAPAAAYTAGPTLLCAGTAAIAYLARRELRATHVDTLDDANHRENHI